MDLDVIVLVEFLRANADILERYRPCPKKKRVQQFNHPLPL